MTYLMSIVFRPVVVLIAVALFLASLLAAGSIWKAVPLAIFAYAVLVAMVVVAGIRRLAP